MTITTRIGSLVAILAIILFGLLWLMTEEFSWALAPFLWLLFLAFVFVVVSGLVHLLPRAWVGSSRFEWHAGLVGVAALAYGVFLIDVDLRPTYPLYVPDGYEGNLYLIQSTLSSEEVFMLPNGVLLVDQDKGSSHDNALYYGDDRVSKDALKEGMRVDLFDFGDHRIPIVHMHVSSSEGKVQCTPAEGALDSIAQWIARGTLDPGAIWVPEK